MTTTPPEAPPPPPPQDSGPRVTRDEVRDLARLRRSRADRKVAGVAGGLGRHLDVDPLILRVAFVVLVFFGGAGLILYGACWLLVPEDGEDRAMVGLDERSRSVALLIVGVVATLALVGNSWGHTFWFPWPVAVVALIALWLLTRNNTPRDPAPPAPTYPAGYGQTYAPVAPAPVHPYAAGPQPVSYPPQAPAYVPPHVPPVSYTVSYPVSYKVPNPRRRGPILFWFTLALIALAEGVLGIVDLAGAGVASSAYPALAVAICGVMLLVGAFFGRAGGIILVGLVASAVLAGTTAADRWDSEQIHDTPVTSASVDSRYWVDAGELVLDLRQVADLDGLDGRTIEVKGNVGHLEVLLPEGLATHVQADVNGPGNISLFGQESGGIDTSRSASQGSHGEPRVDIVAELAVGQIEVEYR